MSDFETAQREWERIPVDDIGYVSGKELLEMPEQRFVNLMSQAQIARYTGYRNYRDLWRQSLIDMTRGQTVLDFGCGAGIDALQIANDGNSVMLADINESSIAVAKRLLAVYNLEPIWTGPITETYPFVDPPEAVDVFYANGVLHHMKNAPSILSRAGEVITWSGEVRLMLYTDKGWELATGMDDAPIGDPREHPHYDAFLHAYDSVGRYAEPWWPAKLVAVAHYAGLKLVDWIYLTPDGRFAAAILRHR